jgi:methylaspartate ammonia-lyase
MTRIVRVHAVPASGGAYYEDRAALEAKHVPLPQRFEAGPVTPGFRAVREVSEAVSVGLELDTGMVAWGDCISTVYGSWPGVAGGEAGPIPLFRTAAGLETIRQVAGPWLEGQNLTGFRELAAGVDGLRERVTISRPRAAAPPPDKEGLSRRALLTAPARVLKAAREDEEESAEQITVERGLHPAICYGLSQALLQALAWAEGLTMAEVIAEEWSLPRPWAPVRIHADSGHERYYHAEKMIVRRVESLPHALVDDVRGQVGAEGAELGRYLRWLTQRIGQLGGEGYRPVIHLDLNGALGKLYDNQPGKMLGQLYTWELAAKPHLLRIENPMILDSREAQLEAMAQLREYVHFRKMGVHLVASAWANSLSAIQAFLDAGAADMIHIKMPDLGGVQHAVDAVLACRDAEVGSLLGGSAAETGLSARVSVHVALATQPDLILAKPGVGVDEAVSLVRNEMARVLAVLPQA